MYIIFGILFGIIGLETILLFFIVFKTPAMTFLMANIFKKPVMYIMGKDHLAMFKTFSPKNGAAIIRGIGVFHLTENSHTLEYKTKTPIYLAFRDLAATLLPEYPAIIQEAREKGVVLNTLDDVTEIIYKIKNALYKPFDVVVKPFKTYKFHDLQNMFPYNLDPTFIDATVQCEVTKGLKQLKMAPAITTSVIILLVVAAVAVFIIRMGFQGTMDAKDCEMIVAAAKCVI
jgi:hypothetical protein